MTLPPDDVLVVDVVVGAVPGPQGPAGPAGDPGPIGPAGPQGPAGEGSGPPPDLAAVMAVGNSTGETALRMPSAQVDGRASLGYLRLVGSPSGVFTHGRAELLPGGPAGGGNAYLWGGAAPAGTGGRGGDVVLDAGNPDGAGRPGVVAVQAPMVLDLATLPDSVDPLVAGQIWQVYQQLYVSWGAPMTRAPVDPRDLADRLAALEARIAQLEGAK